MRRETLASIGPKREKKYGTQVGRVIGSSYQLVRE